MEITQQPNPHEKLEGITGFFRDLWRSFLIGDAPDLDHTHLVEEITPGMGLKMRISRRTNKIIAQHTGRNHKFGKSGQPPLRADFDEYRKAPYTKMYLLYKTKNEKHVSEMEVYYIRKYKHLKANDNESESLKHPMKSYDGFYYLYLVI